MKLHCLGTAGYHPNDQRHTSCYFLPAAGLVFDAGTGIYRLPTLIETDHLDIVLSHAHLDHVVGLTFLLDILYQRPVEQVRIWGDPVKLEAIQTHLFNEHIFPVALPVSWCPLTPAATITVGLGGELSAFPLEHPGGSLGFRVDWGAETAVGERSFAYVSDTTGHPQAEYVERIHKVDLLLHECNFRDSAEEWAIKTGHSWTSLAAEIARTAEVGQLLLAHINPLETTDDPVDLAVARRLFNNATLAADNLVIEF